MVVSSPVGAWKDATVSGAPRRQRVFVPFVAFSMAMVALSIDTVLPAFGDIREHYGLAPDSAQVTWILTAFFLGLAFGEFFFGTLSDRFGRRPLLLAGLGIMVVGAIGSAFAPNLPVMFACRVLWGFGSAGPRAISVAMVRDSTSGVEMARLMSLVMTIFLLVPILAPSVGALILVVLPWQAIYLFIALCAVGIAVWTLKMPETLPVEGRRPLSAAAIREAATFVVTTRQTILLALSSTFLFGAMSAYLSQSELIIVEGYDREAIFPVVFGGLAVSMAAANFCSSRLVVRVGLRRLLHALAAATVVANVIFTVVVLASDGAPAFPVFVVGIAVLLAINNVTIPNANSVAMEPMGAVAGTASSVSGVFTTAGGALLGAVINAFADGSVTPLAVGFLAMTACGAVLIVLARPGRPQVTTRAEPAAAAG
jgi:DHA1 family bicyclomycin/chloramphenicol resistance-like MFS transporter